LFEQNKLVLKKIYSKQTCTEKVLFKTGSRFVVRRGPDVNDTRRHRHFVNLSAKQQLRLLFFHGRQNHDFLSGLERKIKVVPTHQSSHLHTTQLAGVATCGILSTS
jgi:hypothetical protein